MSTRRRSWKHSQRGGVITNLIALVFVATLCAVVYFARHPILRFAAESWVIDEPAAHADAIVLLSGDNFYADRASRAAELIRQGVAPVVVASGERIRPTVNVTELETHDLIERGVPTEKIVAFQHDAENTREEEVLVARFAADHHFKSVILVTSNYHARRALYIAHKVFPKDISVSVAAARDADFDPEHWWEKRKSQKLFLHELVGMPVAAWELR
jgi:uncharacterized SAM-binding protein YcdF (DUF218 family)